MLVASELSLDGAQLNASLLALDAVAHEPVQMKLLAWVMGLPFGIDPALAARVVMQQQISMPDGKISAPLMKLVEVVAQYPLERLSQMAIGRRRSALN